MIEHISFPLFSRKTNVFKQRFVSLVMWFHTNYFIPPAEFDSTGSKNVTRPGNFRCTGESKE